MRANLERKHMVEFEQVEQYNRDEFQEFTLIWDRKLETLKQQIALEISKLAKLHQQQFQLQSEQLKRVFESSHANKFKPSSQLLNLRKIEQQLSKQQNFTEAERVKRDVGKLESRETKRYYDVIQEKIATQLVHLQQKHVQEMKALEIKLDRVYKETENLRKQEQAELLQKFINLKSKLQLRQKLEISKLAKTFQTKNLKQKRVK
mmetsp:Transcript_2876/g.4903  ORF Transcript_2876/g.4903 Transcript_2876/m.4903 type:complete len:205 (-) Transcript_2876:41-655(-)